MTVPASPSPDSLAAVVADIRSAKLTREEAADRIERLDAEMREQLVDARQQRTAAIDEATRRGQAIVDLHAKLAAFEPLVAACETEFDVQDEADDGEPLFPDEDKVSYPEDRCHITFGMIRKARAAIASRADGEKAGT